MYNKFCITEITKSALNREIRLVFNYEVEAKTATAESIKLSTLDGKILHFIPIVEGTEVVLKLKEWPETGIEYQLTIDTTLKSLAGTSLEKTFRKSLSFPQEITAKAVIKSPYNFEKLDELRLSIADDQDFNEYFIEIARDNIFYDIIYSEEIYTCDISPLIPNVLPGQYYVRARCQKNGSYGPWSKVVTFIYKYICDDEVPKEEGPSAGAEMPGAWDDLYRPEIEGSSDGQGEGIGSGEKPPTVEIETELEIITAPESGETPEQFIFEFDKELDHALGEVILIKKDF